MQVATAVSHQFYFHMPIPVVWLLFTWSLAKLRKLQHKIQVNAPLPPVKTERSHHKNIQIVKQNALLVSV